MILKRLIRRFKKNAYPQNADKQYLVTIYYG